MALYIPHRIFPFGAAFVCQAGKFWTQLRMLHKSREVGEGVGMVLQPWAAEFKVW